MSSLDKLLADLDTVDKLNPPKVTVSPLPPKKLISPDQLLADLEAIDPSPSPLQNNNQKDPSAKSKSSNFSNLDNLLSQVKSNFEQKELQEKEAQELSFKQQQLLAKKEEADKLLRREKQAEQWLKKLEPLSTEGLWFTEFAKNYPSTLQAAIDYLEVSEKDSFNQS